MKAKSQARRGEVFRYRAAVIHRQLRSRADQVLREYTGDQSSVGGGLRFRNMGTTAGRAEHTKAGTVVWVNSQLAAYPERDLHDTIAHELAHAVVDGIKACKKIRSRKDQWSAHGAVWKDVARKLGVAGDRCHTLTLKPTRTLRQFLYRASCGKEIVLTSVRHNKLQTGRCRWYQWKDGTRITRDHFVAEVRSTAPQSS